MPFEFFVLLWLYCFLPLAGGYLILVCLRKMMVELLRSRGR